MALGDAVNVGAHSMLRDVKVGAATAIAPYSHIEGADIGARCRIGPYARIRPGTALADEVHIGNFVEVKASALGERSKANHLAYVGDTTVGRDVNIGAGTITCNYDGANKHRTVIEDDVHIGSDTQLVAPVTIGRGATIGAGTTVWRDVEAGALALNEKSQTSTAGYQRPRKKAKDIDAMCGIVGAVARENVVPILIEGIRRLEYRGYDSTGLAVINGGLHRLVSTARVADLAAQARATQIAGTTGISHTRWATHGAPTQANAHPHVSSGEIAVVHNGIIENFEPLRARLQQQGYAFVTQTDTEVIAHLIHAHYDGDLLAGGGQGGRPSSTARTRSPR